MGLRNIFRKRAPAVPLPQLCYDVAYFILPHYADGRDFLTLEYPSPPPVDMSQMTPEDLIAADKPFVLAPYFSCIIRDSAGTRSYYILGQSPIGGGATLRSVTAEGENCNLGPGPQPTVENFHARLSRGSDGLTA